MNKTGIQWTDETWNPVRGCSRVSPGCGGPGPHGGCYAEAMALRVYRCDRGRGVPIGQGSYDGLVTMVGGDACPGCAGSGGSQCGASGVPWCGDCLGLGRVNGEARWTGAVRLVPGVLDAPLRMRQPKRIFVNSMSDLFHESLPLADIFRVLDACEHAAREAGHTMQILTKRARRMNNVVREWMQDRGYTQPPAGLWLGVSVEDQQRADERIPHLLATPAAVRFVSLEPLLGPIDLNRAAWGEGYPRPPLDIQARQIAPDGVGWRAGFAPLRAVDLAIIGGESGPKARPCDVAWIRSIRDQCRAAGTLSFVKQLGARPIGAWQDPSPHVPNGLPWRLRDSHGGDPAEWPRDLRIRELPSALTQ